MKSSDSLARRLVLAFGGVTGLFGLAVILVMSRLAVPSAATVAASNPQLSAAYRNAFEVLVALSLIAVAAACILAVRLARSIDRPLNHSIAVLAEIERGNYSMPVAGDPGGGMGQILESLERTQSALRERSEKEHASALEGTRIRSALDQVSVGVMLGDPDGKIIYLNEAVLALMRAQSIEIRKLLPQFDVDQLLGASMDLFHRVPSHQRNLLAGLTHAHTSDVRVGESVVRIIANPVKKGDGTRIGTVVQWMDRTQEAATEEEIRAIVAKAVDGDLTARIREHGKDAYCRALAEGINRLLSSMSDIVRTMARTAYEVKTGSEEISRGNADLSHRTEEQASSLEETASSMEEMTATVTHNAENAEQASQLAASAREQAERGGAVVGAAVAAMGEINASSKRIADIISVIDEIAFQTNLLALNAAVEAARAGEHGRGFAVVASEVRSLASRSAEAAKEIKTLIQDSVGRVAEGSRLVDQSGQALGEIVTQVKKVTSVIAEIADSSREQASGIAQVNKAITVMDDATQQNAALVEQASAAAQALAEQASHLTQLIGGYRLADGASEPSAPVADLPAASAKLSAVERRSPNRPFSGKKRPLAGMGSSRTEKTGSPGVSKSAPSAGERAVAVAAGTDEWKDF